MLRTVTETFALQTLIVGVKDFVVLVVLTRKNAVITASALCAGKRPTVPLKNSVVIINAQPLLVDNVILIQIVVAYLHVAVRESVPRGVLLIASTKQPYSGLLSPLLACSSCSSYCVIVTAMVTDTVVLLMKQV